MSGRFDLCFEVAFYGRLSCAGMSPSIDFSACHHDLMHLSALVLTHDVLSLPLCMTCCISQLFCVCKMCIVCLSSFPQTEETTSFLAKILLQGSLHKFEDFLLRTQRLPLKLASSVVLCFETGGTLMYRGRPRNVTTKLTVHKLAVVASLLIVSLTCFGWGCHSCKASPPRESACTNQHSFLAR